MSNFAVLKGMHTVNKQSISISSAFKPQKGSPQFARVFAAPTRSSFVSSPNISNQNIFSIRYMTSDFAYKPEDLHWVKGTPINFDEEWGKKVFVLEMWATWCGPCKQTIPHLTKIHHAYKDKGVRVIGISDEEPETVKPFVDRMGDQMDYNVAVDEGDTYREYMEKFNVAGIPHAFIVGKDRKIVWQGHPMEPNFESQIEEAIGISSQAQSKPDTRGLTPEKLKAMSIKELQGLLSSFGVNPAQFLEKADMIHYIQRHLLVPGNK